MNSPSVVSVLSVVSSQLDSGDTARLLAASALVLLMAPGLALFYGGLVRSKSVLNMMIMTFGALAAFSILWVLVGYSLAFGDDVLSGLIGDPTQYAGLGQLGRQLPGGGVVLAYAFVLSGIIGFIVHKTMGFRIDEEHEVSGIDQVLHAETAYDLHATRGARSESGLLTHGGGHGA